MSVERPRLPKFCCKCRELHHARSQTAAGTCGILDSEHASLAACSETAAAPRKADEVRAGRMGSAMGLGADAMVVVFFLAEDRQTGMIVDGSVVWADVTIYQDEYEQGMTTKKKVHQNIFEMLEMLNEEDYDLTLIDFDGPFAEFFWRLGFRRPKWSTRPPANVSSDKWNTRFNSMEEFVAYKQGLWAGKESKDTSAPKAE